MKRRKVSILLGKVHITRYIASALMLLAYDAASAQYLKGDGYSAPSRPSRAPSWYFPPPIRLPFPPGDSAPPPADSDALPAWSPPPTNEGLLKDGPRFPVTLTVGTFEVIGYARRGWPYVIDFLPKPDSCTWVQVSSDKTETWSAILDADGHAGRHIVKLDMPDKVGEDAHSARYSVFSVNQPCTVTQAKRDFSPIEVYSMGAGPHAVGSMAINTLRFGPPAPRFPQEVARFEYVAENDFGRIAEEILDFRVRGAGRWTVVPVRATEVVASLKGPHSGSWDGTLPSGKRAPGIYRLQVRAWNTLNDDKSWVGAISQDSVHILPP